MQTRRAALLTIAGAAASPLLAQHAEHAMADAPAPALSNDPIFFKTSDYAIISRMADLIIPATDTPGALDAFVPYRIDRQVSTSPDLQSRFEVGLELLQAEVQNAGGTGFMAVPKEQQVAILRTMSQSPDSPQGQFFTTIKGLTVDWYYRSEEGLVKELGFHGNTFRANFPGCTHPEHWPEKTAETK